MSFSGGYHSGFNSGENVAESVNFGSERWLRYFKSFKTCECNDGAIAVITNLAAIIGQINSKVSKR